VIKDNWHGLEGGGVDAAFQMSSGRSFFFRSDEYFEYDVTTNEVNALPG
jgi:hypothetical protein